MRKVSILSILLIAGLVVGLAGNAAVAEVDFGGGDDGELDFSANTVLKMRIKSGAQVDLGSINPQEDINIFKKDGGAYNNSLIQVVSNQGWEVQVTNMDVTSAPSGQYNTSTITDAMLVKLDDSTSGENLSITGIKGQKEFKVNYGWNAISNEDIGDMPQGSYTLEISYTASTN